MTGLTARIDELEAFRNQLLREQEAVKIDGVLDLRTWAAHCRERGYSETLAELEAAAGVAHRKPGPRRRLVWPGDLEDPERFVAGLKGR